MKLSSILRSEWIVVTLVLAGAVERLVWAARHGLQTPLSGEAWNVAQSIAAHGSVANVFGKGSGATAHLTPSMELIAGVIYWCFGPVSRLSEGVLASISISMALASALLLFVAFGIAGMPRVPRLAALAFFCLAPLNFGLEVVAFRVWEGALATCVSGVLMVGLARAATSASIRARDIVILAFLCAALMFISPALGLAGYLACGLVMLQRLPLRRCLQAVVIAGIALGIVFAPWTARNYIVFGQFIPLRSNFGLELALANYPERATLSPHDAFRKRLDDIHPGENDDAFKKMQAEGGEIPYARALGAQAKAWIVRHPLDFIARCGRHVRDFYFPPRWLWNIYDDTASGVAVRQAIEWMLSALGLIGAVVATASAWRRYGYLAIMTVAPALPYVIAQPVPRYRYIVFGYLLYFSFYLISRVAFTPRRLGEAGMEHTA